MCSKACSYEQLNICIHSFLKRTPLICNSITNHVSLFHNQHQNSHTSLSTSLPIIHALFTLHMSLHYNFIIIAKSTSLYWERFYYNWYVCAPSSFQNVPRCISFWIRCFIEGSLFVRKLSWNYYRHGFPKWMKCRNLNSQFAQRCTLMKPSGGRWIAMSRRSAYVVRWFF